MQLSVLLGKLAELPVGHGDKGPCLGLGALLVVDLEPLADFLEAEAEAAAPQDQRHPGHFARAIETNQIVLATARAVSENLVKGISEELGRSQRPQVYGASGPQHRPTGGATPLLVSRNL